MQRTIMRHTIVHPKTRCWHWAGADNGSYGKVQWIGTRKMWFAHRASYAAFNGPIPEGKLVLHKCDTPKCVNPEHLWIGTQSDNIKDCWAKGRTKGRWV